MPLNLKRIGVFSSPTTVKIKNGGVWKDIVSTHVKSGGVWKQAQSAAPTYSLTQSAYSVNEGGGVTFTLTTTNVPNGTTFYWNVSGISASDLTTGTTSDSFTVSSNSGSFTLYLTSDSTTEGTEYMTVSITRDGSTVATGSQITINDTSINACRCIWCLYGRPEWC